MVEVSLIVNGSKHVLDLAPEMPPLWALRDSLNLTGAKFGCGVSLCGACAVLMDGRAARSCITTVSDAAGKHITTIEGLPKANSHLVQQAWIAEGVPQCGYCRSGQILAAAALLSAHPKATDAGR